MSFRIPKGFKGAGRFIDAGKFLQYLVRAEYERDQAAREAKQYRRLVRSGPKAKRSHYEAYLTDAERSERRWVQAVESARRDAGAGAVARKRRVKAVKPPGRRRSAMPPDEFAIVERPAPKRPTSTSPMGVGSDRWPLWEFGIDYKSRKKTSDVEINARVRRVDGESMTRDEAIGVFRRMAYDGTIPSLYDVEAVNWRRPGWRLSRDGDSNDMSNFSSVMMVAMAENAYRIGAVEEE